MRVVGNGTRRAGQGDRRDLLSLHSRSEEHTSELQSRLHLVCRLLLEKKNCDWRLTHRRSSSRSSTSATERRDRCAPPPADIPLPISCTWYFASLSDACAIYPLLLQGR